MRVMFTVKNELFEWTIKPLLQKMYRKKMITLLLFNSLQSIPKFQSSIKNSTLIFMNIKNEPLVLLKPIGGEMV